MQGAAVVVQGLRHWFATRTGPLTVLDGVDLHLPAGGYASLVGPSGAGKSTLLSILGGLELAQEGTVEVGGERLAGLSRDDLAAFRRSTVGFVFQHFGLLDALTAAENIDVTGALTGVPRKQRRARTLELLDAVGLADRADHRPIELSGGERQRVAIARALANQPRIVLADEPTGNLDDDSTLLVVDLLETLPQRLGCTLVVVTHDRALAARAPLRLRLRDRRLEADADPVAAPASAVPAAAP
ncbi:ABC transporter ATP-binding protein [Aquihabitans sp. G128]|uniref:ABC transporter ATP-binding protein n=1 Tax=Aquihabitans sp. G128 TaxID=2849779 RepID=UPI001C238EE5|nr:ABC transporter ATP-binding protein [Aquihabitans sp. G128]QXC62745.1 ABC transporter ATP-binding protein [Aquihabitans sp. G128]